MSLRVAAQPTLVVSFGAERDDQADWIARRVAAECGAPGAEVRDVCFLLQRKPGDDREPAIDGLSGGRGGRFPLITRHEEAHREELIEERLDQLLEASRSSLTGVRLVGVVDARDRSDWSTHLQFIEGLRESITSRGIFREHADQLGREYLRTFLVVLTSTEREAAGCWRRVRDRAQETTGELNTSVVVCSQRVPTGNLEPREVRSQALQALRLLVLEDLDESAGSMLLPNPGALERWYLWTLFDGEADLRRAVLDARARAVAEFWRSAPPQTPLEACAAAALVARWAGRHRPGTDTEYLQSRSRLDGLAEEAGRRIAAELLRGEELFSRAWEEKLVSRLRAEVERNTRGCSAAELKRLGLEQRKLETQTRAWQATLRNAHHTTDAGVAPLQEGLGGWATALANAREDLETASRETQVHWGASAPQDSVPETLRAAAAEVREAAAELPRSEAFAKAVYPIALLVGYVASPLLTSAASGWTPAPAPANPGPSLQQIAWLFEVVLAACKAALHTGLQPGVCPWLAPMVVVGCTALVVRRMKKKQETRLRELRGPLSKLFQEIVTLAFAVGPEPSAHDSHKLSLVAACGQDLDTSIHARIKAHHDRFAQTLAAYRDALSRTDLKLTWLMEHGLKSRQWAGLGDRMTVESLEDGRTKRVSLAPPAGSADEDWSVRPRPEDRMCGVLCPPRALLPDSEDVRCPDPLWAGKLNEATPPEKLSPVDVRAMRELLLWPASFREFVVRSAGDTNWEELARDGVLPSTSGFGPRGSLHEEHDQFILRAESGHLWQRLRLLARGSDGRSFWEQHGLGTLELRDPARIHLVWRVKLHVHHPAAQRPREKP